MSENWHEMMMDWGLYVAILICMIKFTLMNSLVLFPFTFLTIKEFESQDNWCICK